MAVALWGFPKGTNQIIRLDDTSLVTDEGAAMPTPYFLSGDVDFGLAGGEGRLRRIVQAVTLGGDATVKITPIANGGEVTDQAESFALATTGGAEQRIEHPVASLATRHAVKVELTAHAAAFAFGEADLFLIPRRSTERA